MKPVNASFGRYRLIERLGQGGMAEVFKAKSFGVEGFEKVLVIKRILPELAQSKEFVDMFIHEAKLCVRLSHANIVQVFDLGIAPIVLEGGQKEGDAYFMAMEYVHGFDLATLLARCRKQQVTLPIDMCVFIASEVAKGLDHAHRRRDEQMRPLGIVHRDVSPQNVLLSYEGEVKVTDFGIAKARGVFSRPDREDDTTRSRKLQGKFGYMSPEHARNENVDARSDLFSLGVVLYECLAGVNPFSAPSSFETLRRVQAGEYPPVELLRPDIPHDLVEIVKGAMSKLPDDRFADAGRMYEAMLAFLYAHGSRYGAHDLAEFLARFRGDDESGVTRIAEQLAQPDGSTGHLSERTPVEGIKGPRTSLPPPRPSEQPRVPFESVIEFGERREVTALAIEMPGRESNALADKAAELIARYGGRIVAREPEQLVALFGTGEPDARDTELAARCALLALRAIDGPKRPSAGLQIGRIHVDAAGEPTHDERLANLVAGARELARVREGRCAVSTSVARLLRTFFDLEPSSESETPTSRSVSLVKDVRATQPSSGRFVGRKEELRAIGEVLALATKRSGRVLTIRGDQGTGKTRLLFEVERRLKKGGYNVAFHTATCPPRGRTLPLSGIVSMLQALCGVADGDGPERIAAVQPRLRALGLQQDEVAAVLTVLGADVAAPTMDARSALRSALTRMMASLCEDRPHAFAWDAAHCMDDDSFALLESCFPRLAGVRVVIVFAGRSGFSHPLERFVAHTPLSLGELPADDARRLVSLRLGADPLPDEVFEFVRHRAGGHPLFVEELVKALLEARAVVVASGAVVQTRLVGAELTLPKTLRGLVASRLSRLTAEERATLQAAAVLGDPIDAAVLATMLDEPVAALERTLGPLTVREVLAHSGPSELRFVSPLVRDVVLDALPIEATRSLHAAAGHALETVLGARAWEHAARIANQYYEAGERAKAALFFAKSGERRLEGRQLEAAAREYARAIELCDAAAVPADELAKWLSGLASAVRIVRAMPAAQETCARVIARADAAEERDLRVRVRVDAARILTGLHMFEAAREHLDEARFIAGDVDALRKTVLATEAEWSARQGDFKRAREKLTELQAIAVVVGDKHEEHKLLSGLAQAHAAAGERRAALAVVERAEQLLPFDPAAACERQKLRGMIDYFSRDFRAAAESIEKAVEMSRTLGVGYEVAVNLHNLGDALLRTGDYPRAYATLQQSLVLCDESGFERLGNMNRMYLAYLDALAGEADGVERVRLGIRYAEQNGFVWDEIGGRSLLAQLYRREGDRDAAREAYASLATRARGAGNLLIAGDCDEALRDLSDADATAENPAQPS